MILPVESQWVSPLFLGSAITFIAAAVFERILQNAVEKKSENDLTG
jgi:hypothetical protein